MAEISAQFLGQLHTPSIAFWHLPPMEGCRKPVLGVWASLCPRSLPGL